MDEQTELTISNVNKKWIFIFLTEATKNNNVLFIFD